MKKKDLLVSFSGGLTSAYMCIVLEKNRDFDIYNKHYVFANTGREREETLQFVKNVGEFLNIKINWVEADFSKTNNRGQVNWFKTVDFDTADRTGKVFLEAMDKVKKLPNYKYPHCTRDLKVLPMQYFAKYGLGLDNHYTAMGIRFDEQRRINLERAKEKRFIYPLAHTFPVTKEVVNAYWKNAPFTLGLKDYEGNCDFCPKKSIRKILTLIEQDKANGYENFKFWIDLEEKHSNGGEFFMYRNNHTTKDLIQKSEEGEFKRAVCTRTGKQVIQPSLFDSLDLESACSCNFD